MWKYIFITAAVIIAVILGIIVSRPAAAADRTTATIVGDKPAGGIHAVSTVRFGYHPSRWYGHRQPFSRHHYGHGYKHHYYSPDRFDYWHRKLHRMKRHWRAPGRNFRHDGRHDRRYYHHDRRDDRRDFHDGRRHKGRH